LILTLQVMFYMRKKLVPITYDIVDCFLHENKIPTKDMIFCVVFHTRIKYWYPQDMTLCAVFSMRLLVPTRQDIVCCVLYETIGTH